MDSGSASSKVNGKSGAPLNPDAKEFEPRNFPVNNLRQQNGMAAEPPIVAAEPPIVAAEPPIVAAAPTAINYIPYPCPPIVPVVYPSVYGTPGTVFFMPRYQVPYAANLLPMKNGNGDYAYFYRVKHY